MKKQRVYLAGGFRSNWQQKTIESSNKIDWVNPREKEQDKKMSLEEFKKMVKGTGCGCKSPGYRHSKALQV